MLNHSSSPGCVHQSAWRGKANAFADYFVTRHLIQLRRTEAGRTSAEETYLHGETCGGTPPVASMSTASAHSLMKVSGSTFVITSRAEYYLHPPVH